MADQHHLPTARQLMIMVASRKEGIRRVTPAVPAQARAQAEHAFPPVPKLFFAMAVMCTAETRTVRKSNGMNVARMAVPMVSVMRRPLVP